MRADGRSLLLGRQPLTQVSVLAVVVFTPGTAEPDAAGALGAALADEFLRRGAHRIIAGS